MTRIVIEGSERAVTIWNDEISLGIVDNRAEPVLGSKLLRVLELVADLSLEELFRCGQIFQPVKGTEPRLYKISRDGISLYCGFVDGGIAILELEPQPGLDAREIVQQSERRLREIYENKRTKTQGAVREPRT